MNPLLMALPVLLVLTIPSVFADVTIEPVLGSGAPGCEDTLTGCYTPDFVIVDIGETITFSNTDTAAHTFTSGTPDNNGDGLFDTGLLMAGNSFEYSPDTVGEIDYFCMVHPWMIGAITVDSIFADEASFESFDFSEFDVTVQDPEMALLENEIASLRLENAQLKEQVITLEDQIISMAIEFSDALTNLGEWYRGQLIN